MARRKLIENPDLKNFEVVKVDKEDYLEFL
jgi:hypothetical protein